MLPYQFTLIRFNIDTLNFIDGSILDEETLNIKLEMPYRLKMLLQQVKACNCLNENFLNSR